MRHRLVVIIWNGEEMDKWLKRWPDEGTSGQDVVANAMYIYAVDLKHAAHVGHGVTRYISAWTDVEVDSTAYREVLLNLPSDSEPEVLIELEIIESEQYE